MILSRGVSCQVNRRFPWFHVPSPTACLLRSGSELHFVGSPAFLLTHMLATFCRLTMLRYVPKNHSLSRTIGPPNARLGSHSFLVEFVAVRPLSRTSVERLPPCNALPVPLTYMFPWNSLPPC